MNGVSISHNEAQSTCTTQQHEIIMGLHGMLHIQSRLNVDNLNVENIFNMHVSMMRRKVS